MRMLVTEAPGIDESSVRRSDVRRGNHARALLAQVHDGGLVVVGAHDELFQVQDDLGDVFLHTGTGGELVQHAVDANAGHGGTRNGRHQGAAKGVTEGVTEARLERLDDETRAELVNRLFGEGWTLCNKHCFGAFPCLGRPLFDVPTGVGR
jgi:hypothetical protein